MRKILLPLALLPLLAHAQIPNGGFENWVDQGGYLDPVGWLTYNDIVIVTPGGWTATTVEQGSPGVVGAYHAVITTVAVPFGPIIQGWISAGSSSGNSGFPYTQRPGMLTGQWQYGIQPGDTAQVQVALSKWNSGTNSTEPVAFGTLEVTGSLGTWQAFAVPFTYISSETPDTAYIQIVSSIDFSAPVAGSFVKVDDLAFVGTVGMSELAPMLVSVFPSPASNILTVTCSEPGDLQLIDASGRVVLRSRIASNTATVDVLALASGLYTYQFIPQNGGAVVVGRWAKE